MTRHVAGEKRERVNEGSTCEEVGKRELIETHDNHGIESNILVRKSADESRADRSTQHQSSIDN